MEGVLPWFRLKTVPGIGNLIFKRLLDRFQSPEQIFALPKSELLEVEGVSKRLVGAIQSHRIPDWVYQDIEDCQKKGYRIITQASVEYPQLLLQIPDPPPLLYVAGSIDAGAAHIAVVGSRNATGYGKATAKRLSQGLAGHGITIVSGMARGIDTAAHVGALYSGGRTIAVLGSGLDKIYPRENIDLMHRIRNMGAVISEFALGAGPDAHHFPARNRIISGICLGTVIVEATRRSGSLITARLAAEQNREVFAVPGSIQSFKSTGTHTLIKQGAKLVEHVGDILDELPGHSLDHHGPHSASVTRSKETDDRVTNLAGNARRVYDALSPYPIHLDDLVRSLGMDAGKLSSLLLRLELNGLVKQYPGKLFATCNSEP
jgi:DNA processing protein